MDFLGLKGRGPVASELSQKKIFLGTRPLLRLYVAVPKNFDTGRKLRSRRCQKWPNIFQTDNKKGIYRRKRKEVPSEIWSKGDIPL